MTTVLDPELATRPNDTPAGPSGHIGRDTNAAIVDVITAVRTNTPLTNKEA